MENNTELRDKPLFSKNILDKVVEHAIVQERKRIGEWLSKPTRTQADWEVKLVNGVATLKRGELPCWQELEKETEDESGKG